MAILTGMGNKAYVDGIDLSNDISVIGKIDLTIKAIEGTGIDKFGMEKLPGQRDGMLDWTSFYNPSAGQAHPTLSTLPRTDRIATVVLNSTLGAPTASIVAKQLNYDGKRSTAGDFMLNVNTTGNGFDLDWGLALQAGARTDSGPTNGPSLDSGVVSTAFGAAVHIQALVADASATVTVQDSADNAAFATIAGLNFLSSITATGAYVQRTAPNATIRRYVRVITAGNASPSTFVAALTRYEASPVF